MANVNHISSMTPTDEPDLSLDDIVQPSVEGETVYTMKLLADALTVIFGMRDTTNDDSADKSRFGDALYRPGQLTKLTYATDDLSNFGYFFAHRPAGQHKALIGSLQELEIDLRSTMMFGSHDVAYLLALLQREENLKKCTIVVKKNFIKALGEYFEWQQHLIPDAVQIILTDLDNEEKVIVKVSDKNIFDSDSDNEW